MEEIDLSKYDIFLVVSPGSSGIADRSRKNIKHGAQGKEI